MTLLQIQFREASVADVLQVHNYLQEQATSALADRFLMALERATQQLRRYPAAGSFVRPRLASLAGLRWWSISEFPRYLIYYRIEADMIDIVRVLHGSRDVARELRSQ